MFNWFLDKYHLVLTELTWIIIQKSQFNLQNNAQTSSIGGFSVSMRELHCSDLMKKNYDSPSFMHIYYHLNRGKYITKEYDFEVRKADSFHAVTTHLWQHLSVLSSSQFLKNLKCNKHCSYATLNVLQPI